jgi:hypothetical protein
MHASYTLCHSLVWCKSAKHSALVWFDVYQLYTPLQFCLVQVTYALHSLLFLMHVIHTLLQLWSDVRQVDFWLSAILGTSPLQTSLVQHCKSATHAV